MTIEQYESFKYRASYRVYLTYKLNKYELWLLCQLSGVLQTHGREIISRTIFFDALTGNNKMKAKLVGYFYGLLERKCIATYEYIGRPGSLCVGITELGLSALSMYNSELKRIKESAPKISPIKHGRQNYRIKELPIRQQDILSNYR